MATKAITVQIPEPEPEPVSKARQGDVNMAEFEQHTRMSDALQRCMTSPSSVLTKQVSLTGEDVEKYDTCVRVPSLVLSPSLSAHTRDAAWQVT